MAGLGADPTVEASPIIRRHTRRRRHPHRVGAMLGKLLGRQRWRRPYRFDSIIQQGVVPMLPWAMAGCPSCWAATVSSSGRVFIRAHRALVAKRTGFCRRSHGAAFSGRVVAAQRFS